MDPKAPQSSAAAQHAQLNAPIAFASVVGIPSPLFQRAAPYMPLTMVGVELAWMLVLFMGLLFVVGDAPMKSVPPEQERARTKLFDAITPIPAIVGLMLGILVIVRGWAHGPLAWTCLIIGCLVCALMTFPFVYEFFAG